MAEFDEGPPHLFANHFDAVPDPEHPERFWFDWGPIFYRGRLDGTASVLCIASDPGPTERIAGRTLVGDAGQRVQGFLAKIGLDRSYLCLNAFAHALHPSSASHAAQMLQEPAQKGWRNKLYDMAINPNLKGVIAFGSVAQAAVDVWPAARTRPLWKIPHPSSHDEAALLGAWRKAVVELRAIVAPEKTRRPNYSSAFRESDYAPIPKLDLPFGAPHFVGDDSWMRASTPHRYSSVRRPTPDDGHTLIWSAPTT